MREKVVFFSPHAGIWAHSFPEALIADAVRAEGAELVYVGCDGALSSFCVPMSARRLAPTSPPVEKERVCRDCRRNRDWLRHGFGFAGPELDSLLGAADRERIDAQVGALGPEEVGSFTYAGVPVGRLALYEFLIQKKKAKLSVTDEDWLNFRAVLVNALRSLCVGQRVLDRERPTRVVVYNSLYSVNAVWRYLAGQRELPVYFLHAGTGLSNRLQTMLVGRDTTLRWYTRLVEKWPDYVSLPCNEAELEVVADNFSEQLRGGHVFAYSAAKSAGDADVRRRFGVTPQQRLLVATMSSYDEYVAAHAVGELPDESTLLFPTQIDWIRALVAWFSERPELFLLIRVHPREFPNKREGGKSEHAFLLERELTQLPSNVRVNWPADQVSLYDIAECAEVFLNAWSNVGKEMAMLGVPVVDYCPPVLLYPVSLNHVGLTLVDYFAAIEAALAEGWSWTRLRQAWRWCVVEYVRAMVDLSDGFDLSEARGKTFLERARNALSLVPDARQTYDMLRRPRRLRQRQRIGELILSGQATLLELPPEPRVAVDELEEARALRGQLRRVMQVLYAGAQGPPALGSLRQRLVDATS